MMIRASLRFLLPALALSALLAAPAAAQEARPALRANVTVAGALVRIGDLIENSGPVADVAIFRSPDLGTRGAVPTARIVEAIRSHQLIGIDTRGLAQVIVTRASRAITQQDISARLLHGLENQYGLGETPNISVTFDRPVRTLHAEASATGDLEIHSLTYDARTTRFDVTFDLPSSEVLRGQNLRFTGTAVETVNAVMVDHPVENGELLKASQLTVERRAKSDGPFISDINAAAGLAARHPLRPGQPLREADLMKPPVVQRNETVTVIYEAPGLSLTLRGKAQDSGAIGDKISVANTETKRVLQGVVTGSGRVTVRAVVTRLVESTPQPVAAAAVSTPDDSPEQASSTE